MVDVIGGNQIALGTKQYLLVSVIDMAAVITDLSTRSPKYTVKDDVPNTQYNLATATATAMIVYCLIDTTTGGPWAIGHYSLWVQFTIAPEIPLLGPFDFYLVQMPALITSGSPTLNGDSTCTINSTGSDIVQASASKLSGIQMWFACRVKLGFASADVTNRRFFTWGADTNNELLVEWTAGGQFGCGRDVGAGLTEALHAAVVFSINTNHTIIGGWDSGLVKISYDGDAFTTAVNTGNPTIPQSALFDIGVRAYTPANWTESIFYWVAAGVGLLSDADCATLNGFGDTDPAFGSLPANPVFLWTCDDFNYQIPAEAAVLAKEIPARHFGPF